MSLSEKHTVPSNPGFKHILSKPDLRFDRGNYLVVGKKNTKTIPRLGVSIKKRDYKLATQRSMLKRKVKNSFMGFVNKLPALDFVVMVRPGECSKSKNTLLALWESIGDQKND